MSYSLLPGVGPVDIILEQLGAVRLAGLQPFADVDRVGQQLRAVGGAAPPPPAQGVRNKGIFRYPEELANYWRFPVIPGVSAFKVCGREGVLSVSNNYCFYLLNVLSD